jgi:hypothetical protein
MRAPDPVATEVEFKPYKLRGGTDGYAVRFDYDPFLVALVKKAPSGDRKYMTEGKWWWWLATEHAALVAKVARLLGYVVTGIGEPSATTCELASTPAPTTCWMTSSPRCASSPTMTCGCRPRISPG